MMYVHFAIDSSKTLEDIRRFADGIEITREDMEIVGQRALDLVLTRTQAGLDYQYRAFVPYSESYAKRRMRAGRNVERVDLNFTGKMLADLQAVANPDADGYIAMLYFPNQDAGRIAHYHNATIEEDPRPRTKIPMRRFMAIDEGGEDEKTLSQTLVDTVVRRINRELSR